MQGALQFGKHADIWMYKIASDGIDLRGSCLLRIISGMIWSMMRYIRTLTYQPGRISNIIVRILCGFYTINVYFIAATDTVTVY
jgi:hypothetical protein